MEASKAAKRRVSVSGMLKYLGVSRSGFRAFLNHKPSATEQCRDNIKHKIQKIYGSSRQNHRFKISNLEHAHTLVFEYIEAFYNTVRIHSHCNNMSPDQFERLYKKVNAA